MASYQALFGLLLCLSVSVADAYYVPISFNDGAVVPILACERSRQIYAVACTATGTGNTYRPPKWMAWSNGTEINIANDNTKYTTATDGNQIFYLLITGSELTLSNTGDRYACYNPTSTPDSNTLQQLQLYAAILKVLPSHRCEESSDNMMSSILPFIVPTSPVTVVNDPRSASPHMVDNPGYNEQRNPNTPTTSKNPVEHCDNTVLPIVCILLVITTINFLMMFINFKKQFWKQKDEKPPVEDV